jgi:hypothetical protein
VSAFGAGNFENDIALDEAHNLIAKLTGEIDKQLGKPPRDLDRLYEVSEAVMAKMELSMLIAEHVFGSAAARMPVWLSLLPSSERVSQ